MDEELETMRLGLEQLRVKYDEAIRRELELTQLVSKLRREKDHYYQRHRALADKLAELSRWEQAHV